MNTQEREHTYLMLDSDTKSGLKNIARYRHSTLAQLIEEGARMIIHRESMKIREDMVDLQNVNTLMSH